ncbi:hypothetical protein LY76DRAFT_594412 [Colletotrichum caudatum]|nr:hypothetical protein LY76DRAFT_594412 [Colletotrichum caudatum]
MGANSCAVTRRCLVTVAVIAVAHRHRHCHRCDAPTLSKSLSQGTSQRPLSREHAPRRRGGEGQGVMAFFFGSRQVVAHRIIH